MLLAAVVRQQQLLQQLCSWCPVVLASATTNSSCSSCSSSSSFHSSSTPCISATQPCSEGAGSSSSSSSSSSSLPTYSKAGTRLSSSQIESLAIFRRFNIAQPMLRGQVILAKVLRTTPRQLLVDSGYYGLNWISRHELASVTGYDAAGNAIQRDTPEVRPGDFVKVRLTYYNTPYGDPQLDPVGVPHEVRQKLVWQELSYRMSKGLPVRGRILNPTVKGYAVAVAGYVALLPHGHAQPEQTRRIGVLQEFYVHKMEEAGRRVSLSSVLRERPDNMEELYRRSL